MPTDLQSRPEFRWLEGEAGFLVACAVIFVLWRELAYLAETQRVGLITDEQIARSIDRQFKKETGSRFDMDPLSCIVQSKLLVQVADGFECRIFAAHNRHLSPEAVSASKKGAFMRMVNLQRRRYHEEAANQSSQFDRGSFLRPNGTLMDEQEMRRTIMLVKLIDNQYGRPTRLPCEYTRGLINDAYLGMRNHTEIMITGFCFTLSMKRKQGDPEVPTCTETALRDFDRLVRAWGRSGISKRIRLERKHAIETHPPIQAATASAA